MSETAIPGQRIFNALNGHEIKKIVLAQIKAEMDGNYRLKTHLTYPKIKFKWSLEIEAYPLEPPTFALSTEGEHVAQVGDAEGNEKDRKPYVPTMDAETILSTSGEMDNIVPPDKAREDTGLQVPATTEGARGETVERPLVEAKRANPPKAPVIARSTEIKKESPVRQDKSER